jgi:transketolase
VRTTFARTLLELAERDERIWLITGDLGYSVVEAFADRFPDRFLNAGVAEQNMTGMAAGLAMSGKTVFVYSIVNFPVMRCLEQVRNDVCYHNLNVKIVAVGGGLVYGGHGYTHHGAEDLAVMRVLPNMTVVAPGDPVETRLATEAIARTTGPCYLRLGKGGEPTVHEMTPVFSLGKAIPMCGGGDVALFSTGAMLETVVKAAGHLSRHGIGAQVWSMPTLSPIDRESILAGARSTGRVVTVEEHGEGGLGSVVAEVLAEEGLATRFKPLRLTREPRTCAGSHSYLRSVQGLSAELISSSIQAWL